MIPLLFFYASLVGDVRSLIAKHDLAQAEQIVRSRQAEAGATSEVAAAWSWLARGALEAKDYPKAQAFAAEARHESDSLLRKRKLDEDPWLPTAVGAAIEVHAQALAAQGERQEAIGYLRSQLKLFGATSIVERIQKNINLLSLEGKAAPALEEAEWIGARPPSLAALRGHPVLLFFWAHWCPDCKAESPIIADLQRIYGPQGLAIVGPTKLYGYMARGEDAPPAVEKPYIQKILLQYYAGIAGMSVPLSTRNFQTYGVSTTPTLVLLDRAGAVQYYHPGQASEAELSAHIQRLLAQ
jgi:thiol-disulfide isomerase/thioredoxin